MIYFNWKGPQGRETVDELNRDDFPTRRDFLQEAARLESEYHLCGMAVYRSSRMCANWKEASQ